MDKNKLEQYGQDNGENKKIGLLTGLIIISLFSSLSDGKGNSELNLNTINKEGNLNKNKIEMGDTTKQDTLNKSFVEIDKHIIDSILMDGEDLSEQEDLRLKIRQEIINIVDENIDSNRALLIHTIWRGKKIGIDISNDLQIKDIMKKNFISEKDLEVGFFEKGK